jgi:hypothetical protein
VDKEARNILNMVVVFMIFLLALQFLTGIYLNLFVTIPQMTFPSGMMMMFSPGIPVVMLHLLIGVLLGLLSVVIVFVALISNNKKAVYFSVLSFVFVIIAGFNGLEFMFNGQNNIYSFFMAVSFIIVLLSEFMIFLSLNV